MRWACYKRYLERLMNEVLVSLSCFFIYVHTFFPISYIFSMIYCAVVLLIIHEPRVSPSLPV